MSAKSGSLSIVCIQLVVQKMSVIQSSRVSTLTSVVMLIAATFKELSAEVKGRTVGIFGGVCYYRMSTKGFLL